MARGCPQFIRAALVWRVWELMATISSISHKSYCIDSIIPVWKALNSHQAPNINETTKKRCRILPIGGLGVSPSFNKSPKIGGYRGLIETISVVSNYCTSAFSYV